MMMVNVHSTQSTIFTHIYHTTRFTHHQNILPAADGSKQPPSLPKSPFPGMVPVLGNHTVVWNAS